MKGKLVKRQFTGSELWGLGGSDHIARRSRGKTKDEEDRQDGGKVAYSGNYRVPTVATDGKSKAKAGKTSCTPRKMSMRIRTQEL